MASTLLSAIETQSRRHLLEVAALSTPAAPSISNQGTPGTTTISYVLVALNASGTTDASPVVTTTTAAATLNGTNFNRLTWTVVTGATGYWIFRTATNGTSPTTTGRIATLGAVTTYDDQGAAGDSTTAPVSNTTNLANPFWSSDELIAIMNLGIKDLWGALIDLHKEHFLTVDTTNVSLAPHTNQLTGVPTDCFRVYIIEPGNTQQTGSFRNVIFVPRDYNSNEFILARSMDDQDPTQALIIYYALIQQGAPVGAPVVMVAPQTTATLSPLRFAYIPTLTEYTAGQSSPIPGHSDNALVAWTVAFARAKEREDRSPDPAWLAVYATEKQAILTRAVPRQEQEPEVVSDYFDNRW